MINQIQIPVELAPRLNIFSLLILLGVFQGLFLTYFFLNKTNRKQLPNVFAGLFILVLSLILIEVWLNYTGFMLKIIWINDFSEPTNYLIAPLFYFYLKTSLHPQFKKKNLWHFAPFVFYLFYMLFYFLQPWQAKYNSFVWAYHPELNYLSYESTFQVDPIGIRSVINELTIAHMFVYGIFAAKVVTNELKKQGKKFWQKQLQKLAWFRGFLLHYFIVIVIFISVKLFFTGRDMGDNFIASYMALIIYLISFNVIKRSLYFKHDDLEKNNKKKYEKSSLGDENKKAILEKINSTFKHEKYYLNNLASLTGLAKKIRESQHHVSQVINEELNLSFFELLAKYRIKAAEELLLNKKSESLTIEEIAEKVGYNSKSAFNKAFKKQTGKTPSEFRK